MRPANTTAVARGASRGGRALSRSGRAARAVRRSGADAVPRILLGHVAAGHDDVRVAIEQPSLPRRPAELLDHHERAQLAAAPRQKQRQTRRPEFATQGATPGNACAFWPLMQVPKYPCIILTTGHSDASQRSSTIELPHVVREADIRTPRPHAIDGHVEPFVATLTAGMPACASRVGPCSLRGLWWRNASCVPARGQGRDERGQIAFDAAAARRCLVGDQDPHRVSRRQTPAIAHGSGRPSMRSTRRPCR